MVHRRDVHTLVERLATLYRSSFRQAATEHGLKLVQLEALVYLASANRYSDTLAALAEYLGVTKGTASQSLKALEERALVVKVIDAQDGRVWHCKLTSTGRRIASSAVPAAIYRQLPEHDAERAATALRGLLQGLQAANGHRTFGTCSSCRHFQPRERGGTCGLTGERLTSKDILRICREHELPQAGSG